jgi:hypothetical protein
VLWLLAANALLWIAGRWLYLRGAWRWPLVRKLTGLPNIEGRWNYSGTALNQDGSLLYEWRADVKLTQRASRVMVEVTTPLSTSISRAATLQVLPDGARLLYDYTGEHTPDAPITTDFFGITAFRFDVSARSASGFYMNYNGRYTLGRLSLQRC